MGRRGGQGPQGEHAIGADAGWRNVLRPQEGSGWAETLRRDRARRGGGREGHIRLRSPGGARHGR